MNNLFLSEEGIKELNHIFPKGVIPAKSISSHEATLEGKEGIKEVYKIDISHLTDEQFEQCLEYIMLKNKERGLGDVDKVVVADDIKKMGFIPIQSKFVSRIA